METGGEEEGNACRGEQFPLGRGSRGEALSGDGAAGGGVGDGHGSGGQPGGSDAGGDGAGVVA